MEVEQGNGIGGGVDVVVDSLPYIDQDLDNPDVRAMVDAMIAEEQGTFQPDFEAYLAHLPPKPEPRTEGLVFTPTEMERIAKGASLPPMDMRRYELPPPGKGELKDVAAWEKSVQNARAQFEHQKNRLLNLEVMAKYGTQAWKVHASEHEQIDSALEKQLQNARGKLQDINLQRKTEQTEAGRRLLELETRWGELVSKNYEIRLACQALEAELAQRK